MLSQIKKLTTIQLQNIFRINEIRHTTDIKKKRNFYIMVFAFGYLGIMAVAFIVLLSKALIESGASNVVPMYLFTIVSTMILFFSVFKAGAVIFQMKSYEMLISLPIKKSTIVISRFFYMYIGDLFMSIIIIIPGMAVYCSNVSMTIKEILLLVLAVVISPVLPITIALFISSIIMLFTSKLKNKSIFTALFTIIFVLIMLVFNFKINMGANGMNSQEIANIAINMSNKISSIYPPSLWISNAITGANSTLFILFSLCSLLIFGAVIFFAQRNFVSISNKLNTTFAKKNYKMKSLETKSQLKALYHREIKRYFASSIYVSNTIMGDILIIAAGVAVLILGAEKIEGAIGMSGVVTKAIPFMLSILAVIAPTTDVSISMEGKEWWIVKTAPIKMKNIVNSKILVNLTFAIPAVIISDIFMIIKLKPSFLSAIWFVLIPLLYVLFSSVFGLYANLKFPIFDWESETQAVKQGVSAIITMITGFVATIVPAAILLTVGKNANDLIMLITSCVIAIITATTYNKIKRTNILKIN